jgi:hypothetical protein
MLPVRVKVATVDKQVYHGSMEVQPAHNAIRYVEVDGHSGRAWKKFVGDTFLEMVLTRPPEELIRAD